jgi:hypothetical protein
MKAAVPPLSGARLLLFFQAIGEWLGQFPVAFGLPSPFDFIP